MTRNLARWAAVSAAAALTLTGALTATSHAAPTPQPTPEAKTHPDRLDDAENTRFIVKLKQGTNTLQPGDRSGNPVGAAAAQHGRQITEARQLATGAQAIKLDQGMTRAEASTWMNELAARADVEYVEVDRLMKPVSVPNDPDWQKQWHYHEPTGGLNLPAARDLSSGQGVTVAVIDTGITPHSDLNSKLVPGYDFISDAAMSRDGGGRDNNPNDEGDWTESDDTMCPDPQKRFIPSSWHGSHVAGTIAAATNNGSGVAGVAADAKILPVRVLGRCGGRTSDIVDAMAWSVGAPVTGVPANPNPAKVVNMSLGGRGTCDRTYSEAVNLVTGRGGVLVVAAGNSNMDVSGFTPANCSGAIAVASTDREGDRSYFSNYGTGIDVSAPGGDLRSGAANGIWSTVNAGQRQQTSQSYTMMQGTSMAAPHVAGVAALMAQVKPGITNAQAETMLKNTARDLPGTCSGGCGAGIVDAAAAVRAAGGTGGTPTPTPTPTPKPTPTPIPGGNLITNGDFEAGAQGWAGDTGTINGDEFPAASGSLKAYLVGYGSTKTEKIEQRVTAPADATRVRLNFKLRVDSAETGTRAYDTLKVQVFSTSGALLGTVGTFSNADKGATYVDKSFTISGMAGREVVLRFTGQEDSSLKTAFLVDDVSMTKA